MSSRVRALMVCSVLVVALLAAAAFAPLPFTLAYPGSTANVLGADKGKQVITISGVPTRETSGQMRMTAIVATGPKVSAHFTDVVKGWFASDQAVMPRDSVYPVGDNEQQVAEHNMRDMRQSQSTATQAALAYLGDRAKGAKVDMRLEKIGGPSAGLMFALGVVDKVAGDGRGKDLTGGRTIAGTGAITPDGKVGVVGGVALKIQAAGRDGASVFLVPKGECADAEAGRPDGVRLIPVTTLAGAVDALKALNAGGKVPSC
ncbi:S16 family serine protease [Streptomyces sp. NPDC003077]|uniref:S16 family serine protease n=1 Tax=Streptomyces sp. NPDC003077 TaxID=3154443 RepID=UPI0033B0B045